MLTLRLLLLLTLSTVHNGATFPNRSGICNLQHNCYDCLAKPRCAAVFSPEFSFTSGDFGDLECYPTKAKLNQTTFMHELWFIATAGAGIVVLLLCIPAFIWFVRRRRSRAFAPADSRSGRSMKHITDYHAPMTSLGSEEVAYATQTTQRRPPVQRSSPSRKRPAGTPTGGFGNPSYAKVDNQPLPCPTQPKRSSFTPTIPTVPASTIRTGGSADKPNPTVRKINAQGSPKPKRSSFTPTIPTVPASTLRTGGSADKPNPTVTGPPKPERSFFTPTVPTFESAATTSSTNVENETNSTSKENTRVRDMCKLFGN